MAERLNFSSDIKLKTWLEDKPAEWAQAIAWRAAMRAVPALGRLEERKLEKIAKDNLSIIVYRAMLSSSVMYFVGKKINTNNIFIYSSYIRSINDNEVNLIISKIIRAFHPVNFFCDKNRYNSIAAYSIGAAVNAYAAGSMLADPDTYAAAAAGQAAADAYTVYADAYAIASTAVADANVAVAALWEEISFDVDFLQTGGGSEILMSTPLWRDKWPLKVAVFWAAHKQSNPEFAPWFAWYEAAAEGEPFGSFGGDLAYRIAILPREWWGQDLAIVNNIIQKLVIIDQVKIISANRRKESLPYFSHDVNEEINDSLGVKSDAQIFARLLAAKETRLPLAVGLFGPWGGGKSFFMALMRDEMRQLKGRNTYHSEIAHIEFNAWHYVDADLWASLGLRIFEGVAEHLGGERESDLARERRRLSAEIESSKQVKADADAAIAAALAARSKAEAGLLKKQQERLLRAGETLLRSLFTGEMNGELKKMAASVGVAEPKNLAALEEALIQARRVAEGWGKFAPGWLLGWPAWLRYPALFGVAWGVAEAVPHWAAFQHYIQGWIKTQVDPLAVAAPAAAAWAVWLNQRLASVRELPEKLDHFVKRARAAYAAAPQTGLAALDAEIAALRIKADNAAAEIEAAAESLRRADSGMLLYDHLTQRAKDGRYVDRQGVVATLRRDLEHLKDHLDALNPEAAKISRIILYIDDLDRCEPARVVEVLQAIHLLLAFPLFAVVVAVDPRWLERSLYDKYLPDHRSLTEAQWAEVDFSPRNYLEKIFQIPFRLAPKLNGFDAMVDSLTSGMMESRLAPASTQSARPPIIRQASASVSSSGATAIGDQNLPKVAVAPSSQEEPVRAKALSAEKTSLIVERQTVALNKITENPLSSRLRLTPREVAALKQVHPFIPTPRALKRMLNVYLLVRLRDGGAADNPVAVMTLLGLEIGFPAAGRELLRAIRDQRHHEDWPLLILGKDKLKASPERARLIEALTQAAPDVTVAQAKPWLAAAFRFSFDPPEDPGPTPGPTPAPIPVEIPMT